MRNGRDTQDPLFDLTRVVEDRGKGGRNSNGNRRHDGGNGRRDDADNRGGARERDRNLNGERRQAARGED